MILLLIAIYVAILVVVGLWSAFREPPASPKE